MPGLIAVKTGNSKILIAISGEPDVQAVGSIDQKITEAAEVLRSKFEVVRDIAIDLAEVLKTAQGLPLKSAEVEFGLSLTGKGNVYVVETTAQASFKIKLSLALP